MYLSYHFLFHVKREIGASDLAEGVNYTTRLGTTALQATMKKFKWETPLQFKFPNMHQNL